MRYPLFVLLREAKARPGVPQELKHSGILCLEWLRKNNRALWLFGHQKPNGTSFIDEIADRVHKNIAVKESVFNSTRQQIAQTIYTSSPLANYINRYCHSVCGSRHAMGIRENGKWSAFGSETIRAATKDIKIHPQQVKPCRWCGEKVFFKKQWVEYDGTIRCNAPDCRRMDYLQNIPQSRGGIDLTPTQRNALDREAWRTQKAINYLNLRLKEVRKSCKHRN